MEAEFGRTEIPLPMCFAVRILWAVFTCASSFAATSAVPHNGANLGLAIERLAPLELARQTSWQKEYFRYSAFSASVPVRSGARTVIAT